MRIAILALLATAVYACNGERAPSDAGARDAGELDTGTSTMAEDPCPPCVADRECASGSSCAQFAGDSFCAPNCNPACASDRACTSLTSAEGNQVDVCIPITDVCGEVPPKPESDAGPPQLCGALVGPELASCCHGCRDRPDCQLNGCYGGWYCSTRDCRCQGPPDPAICSEAPDAGPPRDAGPRPDGSVDQNGGLLDELHFAIVGDTRPPSEDDTAGYPTSVITQIWDDIESEDPRPPFAITTGDYMFAGTRGDESSAQLDLYLDARSHYGSVVFYSLGNHECTGATASNCGPGTNTGFTRNYQAFVDRMLAPIGQTNPYYTIRIDALDGSWTAKLVFVAANAWTDTQAAWLEAELSQPTTYTFVIRHEPNGATRAPGVTPSSAIIAAHPLTLLIAGHTHTFYYSESQHTVVVGIGGAPLSSSVDYGYVIAKQRPDGAIEFSAKDYTSRAVFERFAVMPDGTFVP